MFTSACDWDCSYKPESTGDLWPGLPHSMAAETSKCWESHLWPSLRKYIGSLQLSVGWSNHKFCPGSRRRISYLPLGKEDREWQAHNLRRVEDIVIAILKDQICYNPTRALNYLLSDLCYVRNKHLSCLSQCCYGFFYYVRPNLVLTDTSPKAITHRWSTFTLHTALTSWFRLDSPSKEDWWQWNRKGGNAVTIQTRHTYSTTKLRKESEKSEKVNPITFKRHSYLWPFSKKTSSIIWMEKP